jgi:integrase
MRVFKTTYKDRKGRTKEAARWYVEFRDQLDTVRRLPAFVSKAASEELGRNLDKLVAFHKSSGGQTDPALTRFLTGLESRTLASLVKIGLLAPDRVAVAKPLSAHLDDFAGALTAKGNSVFHVDVVVGRARRVFDVCNFRFLGCIKASKVMEHLHDRRADTDKKRGMSAQTFNHTLQACKQFCRWAVKDRRALENPLAHLGGLNVKTDRRRDRRALTVDELRGLLDTARHGPECYGMEGPERELLYWLAVESGLRSNELRSLTRVSFALDAEPPTVTVDAAYSKHRRQDTLALRPALAAALREFLATKMPDAPAFRMPTDRKEASAMFQADLKGAGIALRDDAGLVVDFHSLRHTFITNLANAGIHPKTAQTLARHSTIALTMDKYTHTLREQEAEALGVLPDLSPTSREAVRATGTDGVSVLASCLALSSGQQGALVDSDGLTKGDVLQCVDMGKTVVSKRFPTLGSVCTTGVGPGLQNQWGV